MAEFKARLVDRDGNPLGTAANPLKISGGGSGDGTWNGYTRPASAPLYLLRYNADGSAIETVEASAGSQVNSDWNATTGVASILNKPDINSGVLIQAKAAATLAKGQPVYITPGTAAVPDVALCDNTNLAKSRIFGLAAAAITSGNTGYIQRMGVLANVDTRTSNTTLNTNAETWTEGTLLFANASGGLTSTRPTSGRVVKVGYSVKGNSATDSIVLHPMENPVWITGASGEDVVLRLGDSSGEKKVSIRDYTNTEVASIDSDGYYYGNGSRLTGVSAGLDINGLTEETSVASGDFIPIYDVSASANRKVEISNLFAAVNYSSDSETATLPASPSTGELFEFIGTGTNWTLTANTGQYIRLLSTVSAAAGTIASTSGYDCVCLIYIGSNVWLVKSSMGILEVT